MPPLFIAEVRGFNIDVLYGRLIHWQGVIIYLKTILTTFPFTMLLRPRFHHQRQTRGTLSQTEHSTVMGKRLNMRILKIISPNCKIIRFCNHDCVDACGDFQFRTQTPPCCPRLSTSPKPPLIARMTFLPPSGYDLGATSRAVIHHHRFVRIPFKSLLVPARLTHSFFLCHTLAYVNNFA